MIRVKPAIYCYQSEVSNEPKHHHETDETLRKHTTKTHKTYENTLKTRLRKFLDVPGALPAGGPVLPGGFGGSAGGAPGYSKIHSKSKVHGFLKKVTGWRRSVSHTPRVL